MLGTSFQLVVTEGCCINMTASRLMGHEYTWGSVFRPIRNYISETVIDGGIYTMEDECEVTSAFVLHRIVPVSMTEWPEPHFQGHSKVHRTTSRIHCIQSTPCLVLAKVFWGQRIEWRYLLLDKIKIRSDPRRNIINNFNLFSMHMSCATTVEHSHNSETWITFLSSSFKYHFPKNTETDIFRISARSIKIRTNQNYLCT